MRTTTQVKQVMASRNKSKSSGLRMLWIPGGRKSHSKGRYDSTSKQISYGPKQKKSEVWSLGGTRTQRDLLEADTDTSLLDGPTGSIGITPVACTIGAGVGTAKSCAVTTAAVNPEHTKDDSTSIETTATITAPQTPTQSTTSTLAIQSTTALSSPTTTAPNSPIQTEPKTTSTMPAKTTTDSTITTTTAEILDENRFSVLDKDPSSDNFDIYDLPTVPGDKHNNVPVYISATALTVAPPAFPPPQSTDSNKEDAQSKQKTAQRNHNNNHHQVDVNSIQSIPSDNNCLKPLDTNLDWIDELYLQRNGDTILQKGKHKKKKKHASAKELDQLDGVPTKTTATELSIDEDEKVVKCLYYTLMCCDCTIS